MDSHKSKTILSSTQKNAKLYGIEVNEMIYVNV
jgi:hypothetical protein